MKRKIIKCLPLLFVLLILTFYQFSIKNKKDKVSEIGIIWGEDSASNTMILYSSYNCSNCAELENNLFVLLQDEIETGNLKLIYKPTKQNYYYEKDEIFYNYDSLINYSEVQTLDKFSEELSINEIEKRNQMYETIEQEIEKYIDVLPTFYFNGKKYTGVYTEKQLKTLF